MSIDSHTLALTAGNRRIGRPPKVDARGRPTRERLLAAATAACVDLGFEGTTLADIARRADVSTPAIYNHFDGKSELMVAACKWGLARLRPVGSSPLTSPHAYVDLYLSDDFAAARTLQLEVHLAAARHRDVRELLASWQAAHARHWIAAGHSLATVKAWYSLLLGLAQLDALTSLAVDRAELRQKGYAMVDALFAD